MRIATLFTIALTPFILSAAVQKSPQASKSSGDVECRSPFHVMHAGIRHTESKGVGYKDGYTTLEWFGIYQNNSYFMPFLDLRGHVFNNGKLAGNVGLGERSVMPSINHIFGLYVYYDVRQDEHGLTVNQISPGIEILGKRMEYRINSYFPVGKHESRGYDRTFRTFQGNRILLKENKRYAMKGVDGEVGAHITQSTRHDVFFGIGPYYFTADPFSAWGGKTRLYWRYQQYLGLEASYSYDHLFKNVVQGTISLNYPFGTKLHRKGNSCPNSNDLALSRAAFAPYRFEIPVVRKGHRHFRAINPATGQPWRVWFVRNTSSSNGTFESPFSTLAQAQNASGPNDMIYVFTGDGTTKGMNGGITLKNGQKLFGSGTVQTISTTKGSVSIPAMTATAPTITNLSGNVITLANSNEISGMNIPIVDDNNGIDSPAGVTVVGANIHSNTVFNGSIGIRVVGSGNINISNNVVTSTDLAGIIGIGNIVSNGGVLNLNIANNRVAGYTETIGFTVEGFAPPTTATGSVTIAGNTLSNFESFGILVSTGMANSTFNIFNNNLTDLRSSGADHGGIVLLPSNPGNAGNYFVNNNTIVSTSPTAATPGILVQSNLGTAFNARFSINNNNIVVAPGAGSYGINMNSAAGDVYCTSVTNNTIRLQNGGNGMSISGVTGIVNIDNFTNNISPNTLLSGNVSLVAPGTCGP
jgi:parallel beta-helix repeat protein